MNRGESDASVDAAQVVRKQHPEILIGERARKAIDGYLARLVISPLPQRASS
jgi:hypothetical protein